MQGWHALALLACGLWVPRGGRLADCAAAAFVVGTVLFCGGVYAAGLLGVPAADDSADGWDAAHGGVVAAGRIGDARGATVDARSQRGQVSCHCEERSDLRVKPEGVRGNLHRSA